MWLEIPDPPMYFDRCGTPIPMVRWSELMRDYEYKVLAKTIVGGVWEVSTVWLGIDHGFSGPLVPIIFETMVFEVAETNSGFWPGFTYHESVFDDFQARYSTETQAREGHRATVREVRQLFLPVPAWTST